MGCLQQTAPLLLFYFYRNYSVLPTLESTGITFCCTIISLHTVHLFPSVSPGVVAAGPASYGMTDTMGRMHGDAQFAGSSSVPAHVEMMGLIGAGNNPMVGMTARCAVAIEEASK